MRIKLQIERNLGWKPAHEHSESLLVEQNEGQIWTQHALKPQ